MSALVILAALTAPLIDTPTTVRMMERIPLNAAASGGGVEAQVNADGKVTRCEPIVGVGGADVAEAMCRTLRAARLQAARYADGSKAYGLMRLFAQRQGGSSASGEEWAIGSRPELELVVNHLPGGAASFDLPLTLTVKADGSIADCVSPKGNPSLTTLACRRIGAVKFGPVRDGGGSPTGFVTHAMVRFLPGV